MTDETHYKAFAAAYARGALGRPHLDDDAALDAGVAAGLRLHRFKRSGVLPRVRRVIGALRGLGAVRLVDVGTGRGAFLWPLLDEMPEIDVTSIDLLPLDALREAMDVDPADDQGAIVHAARDAARVHLRAKRDFAWNATNLSDRVRAQIIQLARDYGARVHVVYCEAPPDVLAARNAARRDPVPAAAMTRMIERWSVPAPDEAHALTYAIAID